MGKARALDLKNLTNRGIIANKINVGIRKYDKLIKSTKDKK